MLYLLQHGWCEQTGEVLSLVTYFAVEMSFTAVADWSREGGHFVVIRTAGDVAHCVNEKLTELLICAKAQRRDRAALLSSSVSCCHKAGCCAQWTARR